LKKIFLLLGLFACVFSGTLLMINQHADASIEKIIDTNFALIAEKINQEISLRTELAGSSNPYDYIRDNQDFNEIVSLGNDALPYLHAKLMDSPNDGLHAYITAIAIESIAKVDLKQEESTKWETAKGFIKNWGKYLSSIPANVDRITADTSISLEEKTKRLTTLGTPALPFILDKIAAGDEEIFPAVVELTKTSKDAATENIINKKAWANEHQDSYNELKKYVLANK